MPLQTTDHSIPIPMEDPFVHTSDYPVCADPTCPDKDNDELLSEFAQQVAPFVQHGLLTPARGDTSRAGMANLTPG